MAVNLMTHKGVNLLVFISRCDDEAQARLQGIGEATAQGSQAVSARAIEVRGCSTTGGDAPNGGGVGAALRHRRTRFAQAWHVGTTTPTGRRTRARIEQAFDGRGHELRVSHRTMDFASYWQADRKALWRAIQHRPLVAFAASAWLLLPEAGEARHPAQRGRHCALEATHLACAQKKARREGRTIVFIDESGLSERPSVTRTWSSRGRTPVLQHSFNWKQLSVIAGLSFWQFYFRFFPGAVRSEQIMDFLTALKRQIKRPLLVIWDGERSTTAARSRRGWRIKLHLWPLPDCRPILRNSIQLRRSGLTSKSMRSLTCAATPSTRSGSSLATASSPCNADPISSSLSGSKLNWRSNVSYLY